MTDKYIEEHQELIERCDRLWRGLGKIREELQKLSKRLLQAEGAIVGLKEHLMDDGGDSRLYGAIRLAKFKNSDGYKRYSNTLQQMGYKPLDAEEALVHCYDEEFSVGELVRKAMVYLAERY